MAVPIRKRGALLRGFLTLFGLAVGVELALRAGYAACRLQIGSLYSSIAVGPSDWRMKPNSSVVVPERYGNVRYRFNRDGFRDRDHEVNSDRYRILILGDSVSMGLGVGDDSTYAHLLENGLNRDKNRISRYDVINLGMFGYGPSEERKVLRDFGMKYKPQLILLQFYVNDLLDSDRASTPKSQSADWGGWITALRNRLLSRSLLYLKLRQAFDRALFLLVHDARRRHFPTTLNGADLANGREYLLQRPNDADVPAFQDIDKIRKMAAANGAGFLVFISPNERQLFRTEADEINTRLKGFCANQGIEFFDPLPLFRSLPRKEKLFNDGLHLSAYGNRALADLLLKRLRE